MNEEFHEETKARAQERDSLRAENAKLRDALRSGITLLNNYALRLGNSFIEQVIKVNEEALNPKGGDEPCAKSTALASQTCPENAEASTSSATPLASDPQEAAIGPNACQKCGGEYGEHEVGCQLAAAKTHNPDRLSPEQVGVADGWRLLDEDEICDGPKKVFVESWDSEERLWIKGCLGNRR